MLEKVASGNTVQNRSLKAPLNLLLTGRYSFRLPGRKEALQKPTVRLVTIRR